MKITLLTILCFIFTLTTTPILASDDWSTTDKTLLTSLIILKTIDYKQTQYIFNHPEAYRELNPVIQHGVDSYGKKFVPIYFITTALVEIFIADKLKSRYRGIFLGFLVGSSFSVTSFNWQAGIKIEF